MMIDVYDVHLKIFRSVSLGRRLPTTGEIALRATLVFFCLILMIGCDSHSSIIHQMDSAYAVHQKKEDVDLIVQSKFPMGMNVQDATILMRTLIDSGFQAKEYTAHGARSWPTGEIKPYFDEATRKQLQKRYSDGTVEYVLEARYDKFTSISSKTAVISIRVDDGKVVSSSGSINISFI